MSKTWSTCVRDSFEGSSREDMWNYMQVLRESWKEASRRQTRTVTSILVFAAVFELLTRTRVDQLGVGPVKVEYTPTIAVVIPVLLAYSYIELSANFFRHDRIESAYTELERLWRPEVADNDLNELIQPAGPTYFSMVSSRDDPTQAERFENVIKMVFGTLVVGILPLAFIVYAFVRLFDQLGSSNVALWISLILSTALMLVGVTYMKYYLSE